MNEDHIPTTRWRSIAGAVASALKNLQFKCSLALTILMVCLVGLCNSIYKRMSGAVILETQAARCRDVARAVAVGAVEPVSLQDEAAMVRLARGVISDADLFYIAFTDTTGKVLCITERQGTLVERPSWLVDGRLSSLELAKPVIHGSRKGTPAYLAYSYPIMACDPAEAQSTNAASRELIGYVHLGIGLRSVDAAVAHTHRNLMTVAIILLGLVVPISLFLVHRIVTPINQLVSVVHRYASGNMNARVAFKRSDEIGQLGGAFNTLADELERSHNQLITLNEELEHRVNERTEQLKELAARDALTGLYNRRHFAENLGRIFAEAWRYGSDLSCLMIDLDNFKSVNDTYGHKVGDDLLVAAAASISHELRASDLAARYGGDEFVVLLPRTSVVEARNLAERIRDNFGQTTARNFPKLNIGLSIGIASLTTISSSRPDALVATADRALYEAKEQGKNCIFLADPVPLT